ncbi:poly(beta-D-mannuronate) C5 epimerase [Azotobacter chroococcum subsp. isscasi]|uniref:glycosyl hydrolase family 28-related protein n=1 Tax=Azotobacter chroococcum TaxID=353 RepID=UPI00103A86BA|nr:glycosyl hydrolase family 28-related protein [Azotobacter chroococcum]TBW10805.1 poly(beta-D-mannuronate) C5 epimerase [Azotobacter chroococcum subsp. isscasi]
MEFNVKDFGAKGDGRTDDTDAIQAAIDAAYEAGGGTVYLPAGEYRVSGGDEASDGALIIKSNVYMVGDGMGETVIKLVDGWDQKLTGIIRSANGEETHDYGISDLTIDGNQDNTSGEVDGFYTGYIPEEDGADYNVTVERVEIREVSRYAFDPHEQTINLTIRDSVAHDNGKDGFVGDFQIDSTFENNVSYNNGRHGFNITTSSHDIVFRNNVAYGNGANGLVVQRNSEDRALPYNIQIEGGSFHDNGGEGVLIKMSTDVTLQGAEIYNNGAAGVRVQGAENVQILDNYIHDNAQDGANAEILLDAYDDTAGASGNYYETLNTTVQGNTIVGSANSTYGVLERADGTDYSTVSGNSISGTQRGTVLLSGSHSTYVASSQGFAGDAQLLEGGGGDDRLTGTSADDLLIGASGDDALDGAAGDDILDGGFGRDRLTGGEGADLFRYTAVRDSYYTASSNLSDLIVDFDSKQDSIDLAGLGFTGLGDGYNGTLALLTNSDGSRTYLRSYEADADGRRFTLALEGNFSGLLDSGNLIFERSAIAGGKDDDSLLGSVAAESLDGAGGDDSLAGGVGNDVLNGGAGADNLAGGHGRDQLAGGEGADTFRFSALTDSYRTESDNFSDLISDFDLAEDRIDLSGLGFSGLGDGHNGTLLLWTDSESNRTYLKNFDADADGRRFEIALEGDFSSLSEKQLILDGRQTLEGSSGADTLAGGSADETLLGGAGRDLLDGGAGDDLLDGGAGRDNLTGGSGADIFRFADRQDSFRNYDSGTSRVDDIVDFTVGTDLIDLSALGYSGLGNGYNGTLIVLLNAEGTRTYLKDREADAQGNHFEIALEGNLADSLSEADIAFDAADLELLGISGSQTDLAA